MSTRISPTKRITFPAGTRNSIRERVKAIAYVSKLNGKRSWISNNSHTRGVTHDIRNALVAIDFPVDEIAGVSSAMKWCQEHGYAQRVTDNLGKRTLEFSWNPEVIIDGLKPEYLNRLDAYAEVAQGANKPELPTNGTVTETVTVPKSALSIPLPGAPKKPDPPFLAQILDLLVDFHQAYPEEYMEWAEAAAQALEARLGA